MTLGLNVLSELVVMCREWPTETVDLIVPLLEKMLKNVDISSEKSKLTSRTSMNDLVVFVRLFRV